MEEMCGPRNMRERGPKGDALRAEPGVGLHGPVAGHGAALEGRPRSSFIDEQQPQPRVAALEAVAAVPAAARAVGLWV